MRLKRFIFLLKSILLRVLPRPMKKIVSQLYAGFLRIQGRRALLQDRETLNNFLKQELNDRPLIVFAPSLDWDVQLFQRPQQLAIALANQGALVLYIQPKPDRKQPPIQKQSSGLFLCNLFVEAFDVIEKSYVYFLTWNCGYLKFFKNPVLIYDYLDDINVFYADQETVIRSHQEMLHDANLLLVTAKKLFQEVLPVRPDAVYCPNGVEYGHFLPSREGSIHDIPPLDIRSLVSSGKPIIGYYGALARWFDYNLLKYISRARPNYEFVLIGPDYDGTLEPSGISSIPNIHWLGVKNYQELPQYLRYFSVATIPFQLNDITHATSPLKLFEYMAGGKPIVVTAMQESMLYDGVLVGKDSADFCVQLDRAIELGKDPNYLQKLDRVARENTWDARAAQILKEMQSRFPL